MPMACDACGNNDLKSLGMGTQRVEREIKKRFSKAVVLRVEKEKRGLDAAALQKTDIIIATQILNKPIQLQRLTLCVAVMPDPMLHFPDFRAGEKLLQLLTNFRALTRDELIIQTFIPEHPLFKTIIHNRLEDFYARELEERKMLRLPPLI